MRNTALPWLFIFILFAMATPVDAGPWLSRKGDTKLIYNHWHEDAPDRPIVAARRQAVGTATIRFNKLHLEHGLRDNLSLEVIVEHGARKRGLLENEERLGRVGVLVDAPYLKSGLLPPFVFRGIKKLLPNLRYRRDKAAGIGLAVMMRDTDFDNRRDRHYGRFESLALGDKIHIGSFSILQSVETGKTRLDGIDWRQNLYRFELGWRDRISLGTEAHYFEDRRSNYAALSHLTTLSWRWPGKQARIKLMVGSKRETNFKQADIGVLEFELTF